MSEAAVAAAEQDVADKPLLHLREDIQLLPGTRAWHGGATWTIADPVRSRFFQISETDMQLLVRWSKGTANALMQSMHDELGIAVSAEEVLEFQAFLVSSELIDAGIMPVRDRLLTVSAARQQTLFQTILHKYLFFRVPLVRPDAFLSWLYPLLRFLFMPWVPRLGIVLGLVGVLLVARNWEQFISGFSWLMTPGGMVAFAITLAVVKVIHEIGHALMCKHFGLRVPTMGVAFLVMWPVLYTDASEGWRLVSRRQRALIAAAGVMTELYLAAIAMVAWFFLPDGIAKGVAFVVATTTWILSVAVNLNPLMRFDGYYFLSDLVNVPNLQDRSFAVARWKLRQWLWGIEQPCPEAMPASALRWMSFYAWAIWIYRFFLFLGIAFLVYHFFFKVLGVFLFIVEIFWFIVRPIWGEVKAWREIAPGASFQRRRLLWGMGAAALLLLAFPWQTSVSLPALLSAQKVSRLFVPADAELLAVHIKDGESVAAGQLLFELSSPELEMRQRVAQADIHRLQAALVAVSMDDALYRDRLVLEQELARAYAGHQALAQELERLMVRAPFAGRVKDMASGLSAGRWLGQAMHLATMVAPGEVEVMAWVPEADRDRIAQGSAGRFWSESVSGPQSVPLRVHDIDPSAVRSLEPPFHAAALGGRIAAQESGDGIFVPQLALYRVRLSADDVENVPAEVRWRGWVVIEAERKSMAYSALTWTLGVLIREAGF